MDRILNPNDIFSLTRRLIDIQSISGNEAEIGAFLSAKLAELGFEISEIQVERRRTNIYATTGLPAEVVYSTHMDTVPPFAAAAEDKEKIYGRGACDAKGIIAAMIAAAARLKDEGQPIGLLFVVGEERDSLGAKVANQHAPTPAPRFLINGEPTENKVATASKGALRVEIVTRGKMAHSAYPHLGESAIEKLLEGLQRVRKIKLPENAEAGPTTMNIGVLEGGLAPNVIPDFAKAQLLYRLVGPAEPVITSIQQALSDLAEVQVALHIPFVRLRTFAGLPTFAAAYTTDIPALTNWGEPILFGPGSIHVAHTEGEFIEKRQQIEAVEIYYRMGKELLST